MKNSKFEIRMERSDTDRPSSFQAKRSNPKGLARGTRAIFGCANIVSLLTPDALSAFRISDFEFRISLFP
jgi:hypothetical protein